jgi:hypothetical protein
VVHPGSSSEGTVSPFPIVHWQGRETDHLLPLNTDCNRQIAKLQFLTPVLLDNRQENKTHHNVPSSQMLHNYTNYRTVNPLGGNDISSSFYGPLTRFLTIALLSGVWKTILDKV